MFASLSFNIFNIIVHGIFPILIVIEFCKNKLPFKRINLVYMTIFSLAYLLVNYTYFKVNNVAIYPGLTYDNVLSLIYMFGILIVLLVVFLFSRWYTEKKK